MCLDLRYIPCPQTGPNVCDGLRSWFLIVNDLLSPPFHFDQQFLDVIRDEGDLADDGQDGIQNIIGDLGVFQRQCIQLANGFRQFQGDLLDAVDHAFVFVDHLGDVFK